MQNFLCASNSNPILDNICLNLNLRDLLSLRVVNPLIKLVFWIRDETQSIHTFEGLSVKNILEYKKIQKNLAATLVKEIYYNRPLGVIELLKNKDVDVNMATHRGHTALGTAARNGNLKIVRLLLRKENVKLDSCLVIAAKYGRLKVVRELLNRKDIHVNFKNWCGCTALMEAVKQGRCRIVRELVAREDVDVTLKDKYGKTVLDVTGWGDWATVKELFKRKELDINYQDAEGMTALMYAARFDLGGRVQELLLREDLDVTLKNSKCLTALDIAKKHGCKRAISLLEPYFPN